MVAVMTGDESALLLPVPAAEQAVGPHRAALDASAADGVPAHFTVLYPFLPAASVDEPVLGRVRGIVGSVRRFSLTLARVAWFGESVLWLAASDEAPLRALTAACHAAFPSCAPYGGRHADVVPHLTIGHAGDHLDGDPLPALRAAEADVRKRLPIVTEATEVILMAGPSPDGRAAPAPWTTLARFPLR